MAFGRKKTSPNYYFLSFLIQFYLFLSFFTHFLNSNLSNKEDLTISLSSNITCNVNHFTCKNGRCIPRRWVCDYQQDCAEGEDELQHCPPPQCSSHQFACGEYVFNRSYCIPKHWRCDKLIDCVDGADEGDSCQYPLCRPEDHKCSSGLCISASKRCDGYFDCRDESDERDCKNGELDVK